MNIIRSLFGVTPTKVFKQYEGKLTPEQIKKSDLPQNEKETLRILFEIQAKGFITEAQMEKLGISSDISKLLADKVLTETKSKGQIVYTVDVEKSDSQVENDCYGYKNKRTKALIRFFTKIDKSKNYLDIGEISIDDLKELVKRDFLSQRLTLADIKKSERSPNEKETLLILFEVQAKGFVTEAQMEKLGVIGDVGGLANWKVLKQEKSGGQMVYSVNVEKVSFLVDTLDCANFESEKTKALLRFFSTIDKNKDSLNLDSISAGDLKELASRDFLSEGLTQKDIKKSWSSAKKKETLQILFEVQAKGFITEKQLKQLGVGYTIKELLEDRVFTKTESKGQIVYKINIGQSKHIFEYGGYKNSKVQTLLHFFSTIDRDKSRMDIKEISKAELKRMISSVELSHKVGKDIVHREYLLTSLYKIQALDIFSDDYFDKVIFDVSEKPQMSKLEIAYKLLEYVPVLTADNMNVSLDDKERAKMAWSPRTILVKQMSRIFNSLFGACTPTLKLGGRPWTAAHLVLNNILTEGSMHELSKDIYAMSDILSEEYAEYYTETLNKDRFNASVIGAKKLLQKLVDNKIIAPYKSHKGEATGEYRWLNRNIPLKDRLQKLQLTNTEINKLMEIYNSHYRIINHPDIPQQRPEHLHALDKLYGRAMKRAKEMLENNGFKDPPLALQRAAVALAFLVPKYSSDYYNPGFGVTPVNYFIKGGGYFQGDKLDEFMEFLYISSWNKLTKTDAQNKIFGRAAIEMNSYRSYSLQKILANAGNIKRENLFNDLPYNVYVDAAGMEMGLSTEKDKLPSQHILNDVIDGKELSLKDRNILLRHKFIKEGTAGKYNILKWMPSFSEIKALGVKDPYKVYAAFYKLGSPTASKKVYAVGLSFSKLKKESGVMKGISPVVQVLKFVGGVMSKTKRVVQKKMKVGLSNANNLLIPRYEQLLVSKKSSWITPKKELSFAEVKVLLGKGTIIGNTFILKGSKGEIIGQFDEKGNCHLASHTRVYRRYDMDIDVYHRKYYDYKYLGNFSKDQLKTLSAEQLVKLVSKKLRA